jgi:NTP pyrophosphatase (non-canonical NTP hydrolase)
MSNLLKRVDTELELVRKLNPVMAMGMLTIRRIIVEESQGIISFRKLNGLSPTTESCTMKVLEEVGELMQLIGKHSGLNGERQAMSNEVRIRRTIFEALDVAQSAITMAHTLCELNELSLESFVERHEGKLIKKGYLVIHEGLSMPYVTHGGSKEYLRELEARCQQCLYHAITKDELNKLGKDPCETCGVDYRNWQPKEEKVDQSVQSVHAVVDPKWLVCENCGNQPEGTDIPERCELCEDDDRG